MRDMRSLPKAESEDMTHLHVNIGNHFLPGAHPKLSFSHGTTAEGFGGLKTFFEVIELIIRDIQKNAHISKQIF